MVSALISRLVILLFGTLYPAYASYKAVRNKNAREYLHWIMYWICFALFTSFETFADLVLAFFVPFYYELKIVFLIWLLNPVTKGSSVLYRSLVHPQLLKHEAEIDEMIAKTKENGCMAVYQLGQKGAQYASHLIAQTAMKSHQVLLTQLQRSYSLGDMPSRQLQITSGDEHDSMIAENNNWGGMTIEELDEDNINEVHLRKRATGVPAGQQNRNRKKYLSEPAFSDMSEEEDNFGLPDDMDSESVISDSVQTKPVSKKKVRAPAPPLPKKERSSKVSEEVPQEDKQKENKPESPTPSKEGSATTNTPSDTTTSTTTSRSPLSSYLPKTYTPSSSSSSSPFTRTFSTPTPSLSRTSFPSPVGSLGSSGPPQLTSRYVSSRRKDENDIDWKPAKIRDATETKGKSPKRTTRATTRTATAKAK